MLDEVVFGDVSVMSRTLRIGIAGITQESNSFAPGFSTLRDFATVEGDDVVRSCQGTNTEVGGFLHGLNLLGAEPIPLLSSWAVSAGPVEDSAFDSLANLLLSKLAGQEFDGLLLALHGAWLSVSYPSADAELVRRIRRVVGPSLPIVVTLDSHANVTPSLLKEIDGLVGYATYPHVDMGETGEKAARVLCAILTHKIKPYIYWLPIPLLAPPQCATTDQSPIRDILKRIHVEIPSDSVLSSSLFYVQPWLDLEKVQSCLVVVAKGESDLIPAALCRIAQGLWDRRAEFVVKWTAPDRLVAAVVREKATPVIVSEAFDGPSGGAPGDNPGLLSILLPCRNQLTACLFIVDPAAAQRAFEIGIGGQYDGLLGASSDLRFGEPVAIKARIRHLSDGEFVLTGPVFTGRRVSMGPTAVLEAGGMKVVVGSRPVFVIDPELYRSQHIEPAEQDIVAVKSPTLFRPGYASMLGCVVHLDMPGVCRGNLKKVPFVNLSRPIYPLDDFPWKGQEESVACFVRKGAT